MSPDRLFKLLLKQEELQEASEEAVKYFWYFSEFG